MNYKVVWTEKSLSQLEKLDKETQKRIMNKIDSITHSPFSYVIKLVGFRLYRLRVGDYRVIVSIESSKMVVFVLEVGHRSSIYKKFN